MTTQHTPGPWFVNGHDLVEHNGGAIAGILTVNFADNRLIAAAPEMLTLLKDIEESLTADDTHRLLREACRKIITKATGA